MHKSHLLSFVLLITVFCTIIYTVTHVSKQSPLNDVVTAIKHSRISRFIRGGREPRSPLTIVGAFKQLQSCCTVPTLIPASSLSGCSMNVRVTSLPESGLFNFLLSRTTALRNAQVQKGNNAAFACYTECAYRLLNLTTTDDSGSESVDIAAVSDLFTTNVADERWQPVLNASLSACENVAYRRPYSVTSAQGQVCSTYPWNLMVCIRRRNILNCPAASRRASCGQAISLLRNPGFFRFAG